MDVPAVPLRARPLRLLCATAALLLASPLRANPIGSAATTLQISTTPSSLSTASVSAQCRWGNKTFSGGAAVPEAARGPCEQCACADGKLACRRRACESRPGCKALHRPDECCPTFQCECEQDGRVYGNGEKLVDPADPCKVCYCQGGEVVCRRIACFLRSDCRPRLVPDRCCPEYDNCPLRGVSTESSNASVTSIDDSVTEKTKKQEQNVKKEITIKEITPVSEIPAVVSGIRIKEVPTAVSISASGVPTEITHKAPSNSTPQIINQHIELQTTEKSLEIQHTTVTVKVDSTTNAPNLSKSSSTVNQEASSSSTNQPPNAKPVEEEDLSLELVNPAFPPLPDDLSDLTHDDSDSTYPHTAVDPVTLAVDTTVSSAITIDQQTSVSSSDLTSVKPEIIFPSDVKTLSKNIEMQEISSTSTIETLSPLKHTDTVSISTDKPDLSNSRTQNSPIAEEKAIDMNHSKVIKDIQKPVTSSSSVLSNFTTKNIEKIRSANGNLQEEILVTSPPSLQVTSYSNKTDVESKNVISSTEPSKITQSTAVASSHGSNILSSTPADSSNKFNNLNSSVTNTLSSSISAISSSSSPATIITPVVETLPNDLSSSSAKSNTTSKVDQQTTLKLPTPTTTLSESSLSSEFSPVTMATSYISPEEIISVDTNKQVENIKQPVTSGNETQVGNESKRNGALVATSAPANSNNALSDLIKLVGDVASIGERSPSSKIEISEDDTSPVTDLQPPADRAEPITSKPIIDRELSSPPPSPFDHRDIEIINKAYVPSVRRPAPTKLLHQSTVTASSHNSTAAS